MIIGPTFRTTRVLSSLGYSTRNSLMEMRRSARGGRPHPRRGDGDEPDKTSPLKNRHSSKKKTDVASTLSVQIDASERVWCLEGKHLQMLPTFPFHVKR